MQYQIGKQIKNGNFSIRYRDYMDNGMVVKMKTERGRDIVDEITENIFPGSMV